MRTGGSHQPPVAGSEPVRARRPRACRGAWDRSGVFLNPNSCMGLEPEPSKEGSWMMAQNDLVVAGIDVAKDKVDVCIRALSLRRTFASTAEGRRELTSWLRRRKVGKAVMEASGGYERDWAKALRAAKIEVRIVDPKRVRSFAQSAGRLAKNDVIDAEMIAWFARPSTQLRAKPVTRHARNVSRSSMRVRLCWSSRLRCKTGASTPCRYRCGKCMS